MNVQTKNVTTTWVSRPADIPLTAHILTKSPCAATVEEEGTDQDSLIPTMVRDDSVTGTHRRRKGSPVDGQIRHEETYNDSDVESSMSAEETERLDRRRYLNKLAAQRCRDRKKQHAELLASEVLQLEARNTELQHSVRKLTREREDLMDSLRAHFDVFHKGNTVTLDNSNSSCANNFIGDVNT